MNTRSGPLPYGIVMATAGCATLAGSCGLQAASLPLLLFAIVQAVWIPLRHVSCWLTVPPPARLTLDQAGLFTIPLGLAIITTGLASHAGSAWRIAADVGLTLTWLANALLSGHFAASLFRLSRRHQHLDGAWFLIPAAWLGAAIATTRLGLQVDARIVPAPLAWLAFCSAVIGLVGYWVTALAAALRMSRHGFGDSRPVLWWIAMGCAGLSAAAIAAILEPGHGALPGASIALPAAMSITLAFAALLLIPVVIGSVTFLIHRCHFSGPAAWPPTFSTAVFALGCLGGGSILHLQWVETTGRIAAAATLLMWAVTLPWNSHLIVRHRLSADQETSEGA